MRARGDLAGRYRDVELVVLDIDGTVRDPSDPEGHEVDPALDALDAAGIAWTFSTGRPIAGLEKVLGALLMRRRRVRGAVTSNDGGIVHDAPGGSRHSVRTMDRQGIEAAMLTLRDEGMTPAAYAILERGGRLVDDVMVLEGGAGAATDHNGIAVRSVALAEIAGSRVLSIVGILPETPDAARLERLRRRIAGGADLRGRSGDPAVTTSGWRDVIVSGRGVTKGSALADLASRYGCGVAGVMAIGDGANDVTMIEAAGIGVAVANAQQVLKDVADAVCTRSRGSGVMEAVTAMIGARIGR